MVRHWSQRNNINGKMLVAMKLYKNGKKFTLKEKTTAKV